MCDLIREEVASAGYKEGLNFVLLAKEDLTTKLNKVADDQMVIIDNPNVQEFSVGRTTLLPGCLKWLSTNKKNKVLFVSFFHFLDLVLYLYYRSQSVYLKLGMWYLRTLLLRQIPETSADYVLSTQTILLNLKSSTVFLTIWWRSLKCPKKERKIMLLLNLVTPLCLPMVINVCVLNDHTFLKWRSIFTQSQHTSSTDKLTFSMEIRRLE